MDLHMSFKPGCEQWRAASRYFTMVRKDIQRTHMARLEPREFLFMNDVLPPLRLRIWSSVEMTVEALQELIPWVRKVTGLVDQLSAEPTSGMNVRQFVRTAIWPPRLMGTIFMERLHDHDPYTLEAGPVVTVGVVNGDTVLLAGSAVSYVALAPHMYGLSVAQSGSFLIEHVRDN